MSKTKGTRARRKPRGAGAGARPAPAQRLMCSEVVQGRDVARENVPRVVADGGSDVEGAGAVVDAVRLEAGRVHVQAQADAALQGELRHVDKPEMNFRTGASAHVEVEAAHRR